LTNATVVAMDETRRNRLRKGAAGVTYGVTALVSLLLGSVYLLRTSFMPYHAEAVSKSWTELEQPTQTLVSALMTVAGGGWLTAGVVITVLLIFPFRRGERWAIYAIPAVVLLLYIPNLWATLSVLRNTPATPPWYGNLLACVSAVVGFVLYPKPLDTE